MKTRHFWITLSTIIVGLILSMFVLRTPLPNMEDETSFNVKNALEHIAFISQDQHSVYDPENHEEVRLYLKATLEDYLGEDAITEYTYDRSLVTEEDIEYDIHNLLAIIEGNSKTGILLVGHYDSRGHIGRTGELGESYGAADDGYALATMLEIARLYQNRNLENSIYILLTDAEETGLYGAQFAAMETDIMDHVGFVINIEARGVTGPAYMFETSTQNEKVIDFYTNANLPVSYSLATAVYTVMPNSTDFTEFLAIGKQGVNFAVLNGLEYYHTPFDNYTNVDPSSIQHYGEQIVPLVEEFTTNSMYADVSYFEGSQDQVFFTLFPNVFIHYTDTVALILYSIVIIGTIAIIVVLLQKNNLSVKMLGRGALIIAVAMLSALLLGNVVGRIVAYLSHVPFNMTYVRTTWGGLPTFMTLLLIVIGFGWYLYRQNKDERFGVLVVGTMLNLVLALLTGLVLSGASFLFFVVGMTGSIVLLISQVQIPKWGHQIVFGGLMTINLLVLIPILFSLYLALTVGGLLALGLILVFYLIVLVPMTIQQFKLS